MTFRSWLPWIGYFVLVRVAWYGATYFMNNVVGMNFAWMGMSVPRLVAGGVAVALLVVVRYASVATRASATAAHAKDDAAALAKPVDDLAAFADEPDGSVVSLVGWVRGHGRLLHHAGGNVAVGLSLHCRGQHLLETLHNLDLVDEAGGTALVIAEGARLLGEPNVQLSPADREDVALVHALELPVGIVPTYWSAFVVRDGDPVMVIGVKKTLHDMTEVEHGRPAARPALGSAANRPLLLIPLAAERRDV